MFVPVMIVMHVRMIVLHLVMLVQVIVAAMRNAGLERIDSGALGFAGLAYARAYRR